MDKKDITESLIEREAPPKAPSDRPMFGFLCMFLATFLATITNIFYKDAMLGGMSAFEVAFTRAFIMLVIFAVMAKF